MVGRIIGRGRKKKGRIWTKKQNKSVVNGDGERRKIKVSREIKGGVSEKIRKKRERLTR